MEEKILVERWDNLIKRFITEEDPVLELQNNRGNIHNILIEENQYIRLTMDDALQIQSNPKTMTNICHKIAQSVIDEARFIMLKFLDGDGNNNREDVLYGLDIKSIEFDQVEEQDFLHDRITIFWDIIISTK